MRQKLIVLALVLVVVSVGAFADNIRPVSIVNGSEPTLQSILDSVYGCTGCVNADTNQQTAGTWFLPGDPIQTMGPLLKATYAGDGDITGIYSGGTLVDIFMASATVGTSASIKFNVDGSITITGDPGVNTGTFWGINQNNFGFYLNDTTAGQTFFTQDSLNGGDARALTYVGAGGRWTIAFNEGGDQDFNDRVFSVESIVATPEPGSVMLLGAGLMFFARKRYKKA